MSTATASPNAFSAKQDPEVACGYCSTPFTPRRRWQTFCSARCRTAFHATEARKEAIQRAAPALFEALRRIAASELVDGETPASVATAAIKELRAP